ncbi:CDP-paratose 2-epimerase [Sphingomonas jejuensis]|uniref:CDP-paratose 2-epimerase n=1 Tax=Sphingomonas jejuensis TaxID=904715 RepID=A0ABX0XLA9_9SPHN|nr:CDP-paratose 2-epimerase [Sphingomonas jejuensis]
MSAGRPLLVTGGAGFIGSNLADRLARDGRDVIVYDAMLRSGVEANARWLADRHPDRIRITQADLRDTDRLKAAVAEAGAVFHLAAQVAVTTSLVDPVEDFQVNLASTFALLEAARAEATPVPVIFASTNKVYGDLADVELEADAERWSPVDPGIARSGVDENRPLDFHTPYGCSKGAADQYVLDYGRSYGVPSCVFRMSCIYGPRQMGNEEQGWVAHFLREAIARRPITLFGDGKQVRDVMHVDNAVAAYVSALSRIEGIKGRAFNLGGGRANAVSLRQVIDEIGRLVGQAPEIRFDGWRQGDQRWFVADARRARLALDLPQPMDWRQGLADLHRWLGSLDADAGRVEVAA